MKQFLRTRRIHLRSAELATDTDNLYRWENDTTSWSSDSTLNPVSSSMIKQYIIESTSSIVERGQMLLIIETSDADAIGYVQLLGFDAISRRVGIGIYICPERRRQGYAKECFNLVQHYAFERLGCHMVYADVLASNIACSKLLESLGYTHTATLPQWHWADGAYHDLKYYQLWKEK